MKKMVLAFVAAVVFGFCVSANAEVKFRSKVDSWNTAVGALAVPPQERQYYMPYLNVHPISEEKLAAGEELYQLEEDYLLREKVLDRLGVGFKYIFGKKGDFFVRNIKTKEIVRDPRCGNEIVASMPLSPPMSTVTPQQAPPQAEQQQVARDGTVTQSQVVTVIVPSQPAPAQLASYSAPTPTAPAVNYQQQVDSYSPTAQFWGNFAGAMTGAILAPWVAPTYYAPTYSPAYVDGPVWVGSHAHTGSGHYYRPTHYRGHGYRPTTGRAPVVNTHPTGGSRSGGTGVRTR